MKNYTTKEILEANERIQLESYKISKRDSRRSQTKVKFSDKTNQVIRQRRLNKLNTKKRG